jgi:threonylcarbamoyladenosine tRNA methylthiotransferase MtaB
LHVFTYSERDNTLAATMPNIVPINVRNEHNKTLRNLSYMKQQYFNNHFAGQTRKVLFEEFEKNGMMEGYTDNYIRITAPYKKEWSNEIIDWIL